ncbi:MAG: hypothetical protein K0Q94_4043, partial [Paenibacillus sp.]|nr:hypothetical protein [Paenibacillus sp.]
NKRIGRVMQAMTKAEFFDMLDQKLRGVPEPDRTQIIQRYEDLFHHALASGETEEQVVHRILYQGSGAAAPAAPGSKKSDSSLRLILGGFALILFNLIFVLGPFIAVCAVLFSLGLAGIILLTSPFVYYFANGIPDSLLEMLFVIFSCTALFGLGLILTVGVSYVGPKFMLLIKKYIGLNVKAARGY